MVSWWRCTKERDERRSVYFNGNLRVVNYMSVTLLGEYTHIFSVARQAEEEQSLMEGGSFQYDSQAPSHVTSIGFTPVGGTPFQKNRSHPFAVNRCQRW